MPGINWHTVHGFGVLLVERPDASGQHARRRAILCARLAGMLKKSLRANYRRKLARPLMLADGTKLVTLRDAANVLLDAANARSVPDYAIRFLSMAAETGKRTDIAAATDAIERVLRARQLL